MDDLKRLAALKAVEYVGDGQLVGLGTGSTARHVVLEIGKRVKAGLRITGVPTSEETADLARQAGIPLLGPDDVWAIDVAIDGADQVDPNLNLIKGGGGALLKEKIVAAAARQVIIVVDPSKQVPVLGGAFPLPIEIIPFGWRNTVRCIEAFGGKTELRMRNGTAFRTEAGHYIVDLQVERIDDPALWERQLTLIPGVVETGLFVDRTDILIVGTQQGVEIHRGK